MKVKSAVVRTALGTAVVAAAIVTTAGTASADVQLQPSSNDTTQNADINGYGSGSAAGSGHALGSLIGRLLFHNDN
ncbi:hypothetical protein [Nocardia seriolae]|uniref:Uncharacterized protein n=1 Tax=Nocardia seriolae TaxID=37332 RepID=A0A0B8NBZ5_9NOCA|nr:hypothetical protein [Nocardia seriolae]MTJ66228.1 hypothetical protein [Nocardia seriolae]MTJ74460.1 hypothetical protein [Nocardia seriolae]MTJ85859.1 hypothetical protein [Nocardia seriolae]MTK29854.1 hypothetical protein [Nocardia seriolae]MTK44219.1 hypothetical protein [Nocardia seriolae]